MFDKVSRNMRIYIHIFFCEVHCFIRQHPAENSDERFLKQQPASATSSSRASRCMIWVWNRKYNPQMTFFKASHPLALLNVEGRSWNMMGWYGMRDTPNSWMVHVKKISKIRKSNGWFGGPFQETSWDVSMCHRFFQHDFYIAAAHNDLQSYWD